MDDKQKQLKIKDILINPDLLKGKTPDEVQRLWERSRESGRSRNSVGVARKVGDGSCVNTEPKETRREAQFVRLAP